MNTTKHKRGDVREDGMVFWRMQKGKPCWTTQDRYAERQQSRVDRINKRREDFKNTHRTLRKGDTREDGMIFLSYQIESKDFETWVTPERFERSNKADVKHKRAFTKTDEYRTYQRRYTRNKRATNPLYALTHRLRGRLYGALREGGYKKNTKTADSLGCSYEDFYKHIEDQFTDGMSWDRLGEIHIDHRLPLSAGKTEEEILVLNHHRNLQPMWEKDNLIKGDTYCPKELEIYLTKYL